MKYSLEVPDDYDMKRLDWRSVFACDDGGCDYRTPDSVMLVKHVFQEHYNLPMKQENAGRRQRSRQSR